MSVTRRPLSARATVWTLLVVTVGFAVGLGTALGVPGWAALAVAGGFVTAWGQAGFDDDRYWRLAAASLALPAGAVAVAAGTYGADGARWVVLGLGLAAAVVAVETMAGVEAADRVVGPVARSLTVCLGGAILLATAFGAVAWDRPVVLGRSYVGLSTGTVVSAFLAVQFGVIACAQLLALVRGQLRGWDLTPERQADGLGLASRFAVDVTALPRWYLVALAAQVLLVGVEPVTAFVAEVLAARPAIDRAVSLLLLSGVVQGVLGGVACLLVALLAASFGARVLVQWTSQAETPGRAIAVAASGVVAVAVATVVGLLRWVGPVAPGEVVASGGGSPAAFFGAVLVVPGLVAAGLVAAGATIAGLRPLSGTLPLSGGGYALGSALLFGATVLGADGVPAVVVLVGAAATLAVWRLGTYALGVERDTYGVGPSQRAAFVHATGLALALGAGVALAVVVGYGLVPLVPPVPDHRAVLAVALLFVATVNFVALYRLTPAGE